MSTVWTADNEASEVVRAIVGLAHNLGLDVIAEGVESAEQLAQLKLFGCEYGQGYLFSRPVPFDDARALTLEKSQTLIE